MNTQNSFESLHSFHLLSNRYIKGNVGLCLCLFSTEIQTAGQIGMKFGTKFGMEVILEGGKVIGFY